MSQSTITPGWTGRYFEDFIVGDHYEHPLGRTISDADNTWFTLLTMNTAETHFNAEVGRRSEFGGSLVNSTLTLAIAVGQSVIDTSYNAIANLGWHDVRLTAPVLVGDTLWSESRVLALRDSKSRPHAGIVTVATRTINQHGVEVLSFTRTFMAYRRTAVRAVDARPNPTSAFRVAGDLDG